MKFADAEILIIGSLNIDFVLQVDRLPRTGETVAGNAFQTLPGGKGANQAYTVGQLGGRGAMVGCIGADIYGEQLCANLGAVGVDTSRVRATSNAATGVAFIAVEQTGQNQIIITAGANDYLSIEEVASAVADSSASHMLLQLESPLAVVEAAVRVGRAAGMTIVLDPAPARPLPPTLLAGVGLLTPNESEARALLGLGDGGEVALDEAPELTRRLRAAGPHCVLLKLGAKGVWLDDGARSHHFPARPVTALDTTAAGDCFNGALSIALAERASLDQAIEFAIGAASLSVTRFGAQSSIPARAEVDVFRQVQRAVSEVVR